VYAAAITLLCQGIQRPLLTYNQHLVKSPFARSLLFACKVFSEQTVIAISAEPKSKCQTNQWHHKPC
jgi:hypothetical protein